MSARIGPGTRAEIGPLNSLICRIAWRVAGTDRPPRLFTTLARHRGLFRRWLIFAGGLMPRGRLPRRDTELVILRVAHLSDCDYERSHHEPLALAAGLSGADVERVAAGPDAAGWKAGQAALLRAVDELHADRRVSDGTWQELSAARPAEELIEICLLAGHYEMLAGTINSIGIETDQLRRRAPGGRLESAMGFNR